MFDVEGFILVGGQSSRMGSDKAGLVFGDQTSVDRIAAALRPVTGRVRLVGSRDQGDAAGLENIPDTLERWGALAGIHAALAACQSHWSLIVACDLPLVTTALFDRLRQIGEQNQGEIYDAIVPIQSDGRPQPLCAFYRPESCFPAVQSLIADGEHKPRTLLPKVRMRWVDFGELSDLPDAGEFFLNVNTPVDYKRARDFLMESRNRVKTRKRSPVAR